MNFIFDWYRTFHFFRKTSVFVLSTFIFLAGSKTFGASSQSDLVRAIHFSLQNAPTTYQSQTNTPGVNTPTPELAALVQQTIAQLNSPDIVARTDQDLALRALRIQTLNHLEHVSFSFEKSTSSYPHDFAVKGPYPFKPTLLALAKAAEFFKIISATQARSSAQTQKNPDKERSLLDEQKALVKRIINDSYTVYQEMRSRLASQGPNASFPEFKSLVEYLELKIQTDDMVAKHVSGNAQLSTFKSLTLGHLEKVKGNFPYTKTIDAVQRSLEFLDVIFRADDPSRSPKLYHSGRYEYYTHFLEAATPNHIMMPTLASLGATDILKVRGVPIGFVGVNTDITWVDGYHQTPYEFYVHDINHTRRMWQFMYEDAAAKGISITEYARISDHFVKTKLLPLISISKDDDETTKNKKRLRKVLLFEMLHEDALPAASDVIERALLRPPNMLTPFENIVEGNKVVYVMEPGATTLAYVYRKLAHDFYDMPAERINNIVAPEFRTRENVVQAAEDLSRALGLSVNSNILERYTITDEGFPNDFRNTLVNDIAARSGETIPLINVRQVISQSLTTLLEQVKNTVRDVQIDPRHSTPTIKSVVQNGKNISVNLELVLKDGQKMDYQIQIPQEQLSIDKTVGTVDQIKGNKRVIEIQSGKHLVISDLKDKFLSNLDPSQYWVVLKAQDPQAQQIIQAAEQRGFETIMLGTIGTPVNGGANLPTFYAMATNEADLGKTWNGLISNDAENKAKHVRLDFNRIKPTQLAGIAKGINESQTQDQSRLKAGLQARGISLVDPKDLGSLLQNRLPVLFSGASKKSWPLISDGNQQEVIKAIQQSLSVLDPSKVLIVTGATDYGVEKIVHEEARKKGFVVLGTVVELAGAQEVGPVTHATTMGSSWFGKSRPVLQFIKKHSGTVIFIGGGEILKDEIKMARNLDVDFYLMRGPEGAANDVAKDLPARSFVGASGLINRLQLDHATLLTQKSQGDRRAIRAAKASKTAGQEIKIEEVINKAQKK